MAEINIGEFGADYGDGPNSSNHFKGGMVFLKVADGRYVGFNLRLSNGAAYVKTEKVIGKRAVCWQDGHNQDNHRCGDRCKSARENNSHEHFLCDEGTSFRILASSFQSYHLGCVRPFVVVSRRA
jgi:hypothetical protein